MPWEKLQTFRRSFGNLFPAFLRVFARRTSMRSDSAVPTCDHFKTSPPVAKGKGTHVVLFRVGSWPDMYVACAVERNHPTSWNECVSLEVTGEISNRLSRKFCAVAVAVSRQGRRDDNDTETGCLKTSGSETLLGKR